MGDIGAEKRNLGVCPIGIDITFTKPSDLEIYIDRPFTILWFGTKGIDRHFTILLFGMRGIGT